jgi:hypothetical protein
MNAMTDSQVDKLLRDISSIKATISQNRHVIRLILLPAHFRLLYLLFGLSVIGFSVAFHLLIRHHGSFEAIPTIIKSTVYTAIVMDWILLGLIKWLKLADSLSKIDKRFTVPFFLQEFFSFRIVHVYLPLLTLMICMSIIFVQRSANFYVIPTVAVGLGLLHNFIGSVTQIRQWLISGYWFLATGFFLLAKGSIYAPLAASLSLGVGCLLFAVSGWAFQPSHEE